MTQEDKKLLLKDLSARLSYGVKVAIEYSKDKYTHIYDLREIDNDTTSELRQQVTVWNYGLYSSVISYPFIDCRPYLRPLSSMTEEERKEVEEVIKSHKPSPDGIINNKGMDNLLFSISSTSGYLIDWLNAHHFDYRGLIEKGLAIEAPEEMYK